MALRDHREDKGAVLAVEAGTTHKVKAVSYGAADRPAGTPCGANWCERGVHCISLDCETRPPAPAPAPGQPDIGSFSGGRLVPARRVGQTPLRTWLPWLSAGSERRVYLLKDRNARALSTAQHRSASWMLRWMWRAAVG